MGIVFSSSILMLLFGSLSIVCAKRNVDIITEEVNVALGGSASGPVKGRINRGSSVSASDSGEQVLHQVVINNTPTEAGGMPNKGIVRNAGPIRKDQVKRSGSFNGAVGPVKGAGAMIATNAGGGSNNNGSGQNKIDKKLKELYPFTGYENSSKHDEYDYDD
jgi:hypothetical protein